MKLPLLLISALAPALLAAPTNARTYLPEGALIAPIFTPPTPVVQAPLPNIRIDASFTVEGEDDTTLTIQRGAASIEPSLPPPAPPAPAAIFREPTAAELTEQASYLRRSISLGATVYDHKVSEINWTDPQTGQHFQAICGFDIGLLADVGGFIHAGEDYSLSLMHSDIEGAEFAQIRTDGGTIIPQVPLGIIRITLGNPDHPTAIAPLYLIKDLIQSEKQNLTTYQAARKKYQQQATAWAAANPPIPQDQTIIFRPHRGSRYLTDPQPEKKVATAP